MIHRVVYGSLERFIGVMIENYAGKFPLWLAPEQIRIIPISDRHLEYAEKVKEKLEDKKISVSIDGSKETMQSRIRDAELMKIPYILVVGDKDQDTQTVSVRPVGKKDLGIMKLEEFIKKIKEEIVSKGKNSII
jgi:threonyl-tRNA synthetase